MSKASVQPITKKAAKVDPSQMTFSVFFPPVVTLNGDGSYRVSAGRPVVVEWLSPKDFAQQIGVNRKTVYHWIETEYIPRENDQKEPLVEPEGRRRWKISSKALAIVKAKLWEERENRMEGLNRGDAETRRLI